MDGRMVVLRSPVAADFDRLEGWLSSDSSGTAYTGDLARSPSAEQLASLHAVGDLNYLMVLTRDGTSIGAVGWAVRGHSRAYTISVLVAEPDYWRRGHGAEAVVRLMDYLFQTLDAWRLEIVTGAFNSMTVPVLARLRMTIEGVLRDYFYLDGRFHDATVWSLLRPEYDAALEPGSSTSFLPYQPLVPEEEKARARAELDRYLADCPNASWLRSS